MSSACMRRQRPQSGLPPARAVAPIGAAPTQGGIARPRGSARGQRQRRRRSEGKGRGLGHPFEKRMIIPL
ncbi:hypothetical protein GW17_00058651 [Ensete ventricosum]|nr:hypothetical protein GW17_00058651 [Ensete ventricosum]RZS25888.1 hypothetical protein BHM03_00059153 [Ensete ventricosum]